MKALDMQRCGVTTAGASIFLDVMKYNTSLVVLDLRYDRVSAFRFQALGISLFVPMISLRDFPYFFLHYLPSLPSHILSSFLHSPSLMILDAHHSFPTSVLFLSTPHPSTFLSFPFPTLEKRLRILPDELMSKKRMGQLTRHWNIFLWSWRPADTQRPTVWAARAKPNTGGDAEVVGKEEEGERSKR